LQVFKVQAADKISTDMACGPSSMAELFVLTYG